MKRKISASLLAFMLVFQVMSSSMLMPFTALATGANPTQTNDATDATENIESSEAELAANKTALEEATKAVNALFTDETKTTIKDGLIDAMINTAEVQVNLVAEGEEKSALQQAITEARTQVAATAEKAEEVVAQPVVKKETTEKATEEKATEEVVKETTKKTPVKKSLKTSAAALDAELVGMTFAGFYVNETKYDLATYHPKIGDSTLIRFNWELPDASHGYKKGQQFTFKLPANFAIAQYLEGPTNAYGNYSVDTAGNVVLTLTEAAENKAVINGYLQFETKFQKAASNELEQTIDFGKYGGSQKLTFTPNFTEMTPTVVKEGSFYRDATTGNTNAATINPDGVDWKITVNSQMASLKNAKIIDSLPLGQELVGDIKVDITASPGLDGKPSNANVTTKTFTSLPVELGDIDSKVVLTFKTKTTNPQTEYKNIATLEATYDGNTVTPQSTPVILKPVNPKPIVKSGAANNTSINWEVKANMNGAIKKGQDFVLTDTLSGPLSDYQKFDASASSILVEEYSQLGNDGLPTGNGTKVTVAAENITVSSDGKTLTVKIPNSTGNAYKISYKTVKSKAITESGDVTNTASINDTNKSSATKTVKLNESTYITKSNGSKVRDGIVKWTIVANSQKDIFGNGATITDTLDDRLDWLDDPKPEFDVREGNKPLTLDTDYSIDINGKVATITFLKEIKDEIVIDYQTKYTIDSSQGKEYVNKASFNGTVDTVSKTQTVTSKFTQMQVEQYNGSKDGAYEPATKQFKWTVIVNNNNQNWTNAELIDTLPTGHELVANSFKVDDNDAVVDSSVAGKISYNIGTLNKKIVVTYATKDSDGLLEKNNNNTVVIKADNSILNTFTKNIEVTTNNDNKTPGTGNAFVTKSAGNNIGRTIPWTMTLNDSLSTLTNAVLTDTTDGQQIFDPTSFELTKSTVVADGSSVKVNWGTAEKLVVGDHADYKLELTYDSQNVPTGFKLTFKNPVESAYKLTYKSKFSGKLGENTENTADLTFDGSTNNGLANTGAISKMVRMSTGSGGASTVTNANLKVIKTDDKGNPLKGVEFTLYNFDGTKAIQKTDPSTGITTNLKGLTDAKGELFFNGLPVDEYVLKETGVLPGYEATVIDTLVILGNDETKTVTNTKIPMCVPSITVTKNDNNITTLELLKEGTDGKFTVVKTPDGQVVTAKIGTDGKVTLPDLDAGKYKFDLTTSDKVNNKISTTTVFEVNEKGVSTCATVELEFEIIQCTTFDITVVNQDGSRLAQDFIENSKFKLVDTKDVTKVIENITINADGKLIDASGKPLKDTLKKGEYTIIQTITPMGYKAIVDTISVTNADDICLAEITLTTTPIACPSYSIVATDASGNAMTTATTGYTKFVNEAKFTLKDSKGVVLDNITIDQNTGKLLKADKSDISLADLKANEKYTLEQSNTVIGYTKLAATDVTPSLTDCLAKVNVAIKDVTVAGCTTFEITVKDETGAVLNTSSKYFDSYAKNSEFTLVSSDSSVTPLTGVKINTNGKLVKADNTLVGPADLTSGEYTLEQTKTPPGFTPVKAAVNPNGTDCSAYVTINFNLTTEPTTPGISCPDFTINYVGPTASQAEFKLVKVVTDAVTGAKTETDVTTDIKVVTDATTNKQTLEMKDSTGKVITALEAGDYKLVQTKTHPGYQATSSTFTVIEGVCQAEMTVSNSPTPPPVCDRDTVITITDLDGTPVVPNEKTVVTVDGKPVNFTVENDKVVIPKTEIPNTADSSVVITLEDGRTTTTTLSKDRVDCTVDVQVPVLKVCDKNPTITIKTKDGKEVPATLVEKVTVNGTEIPVITENSKVVIPNTSVNPKEDTVVTITLKDGTTGTVTVPKFSENCEYEVEITPYACEKATVMVKVNGEAEAGITVKVVNDKGQTVQTATTDNKGVATIQPKFADENHKVWVTIFEETKSYAFKDCAVKINVKPTPNVEGDTEENTPPNVEGNTTPPTPGVKGDKEDNKNDVKVPTFSPPGKTYNVYDENGDLVARNVKVGKDGKIDIKNLPAGKYTLVAVDGDKKISFEVGKNGLLPQTGAQDVMLYSLMGIVLLAAGVLLIGRNRRKNA